MSVIKIPTSFNIEVEFEIPEFYRRTLALVIDMLVKYVYFRVMAWLFETLVGSENEELTSVIGWMLIVLPIIVYHLLMEITMNGQSVGKRVMGIKVVDENGGRASISQFVIRWLLRVSDVWVVMILWILLSGGLSRGTDAESWGFVLGAIAFFITDIILVVSSKKGQRIGDMLAHTILINTRSRMNIEETVFQEVANNYVPTFPQIMQLSDKDINAIKSILETARKKNDFNMAAAAAEKIKGHLGIETELSPFDFLDILLKDYNYLSAS